MSNLAEHGAFAIRREGRVLVVRAQGTWNYPTASRFSEELLGLARQMGDDAWAICYLAQEWQLMTPESIPLAQQATLQLDKMGRTHTVTVLSEHFLDLAREQVLKAFCADQRTAKLGIFVSQEQAQSWLQEEGFDVQLPAPS